MTISLFEGITPAKLPGKHSNLECLGCGFSSLAQVASGVVSSTVAGRGYLTEASIEFSNQEGAVHSLRSGSSELTLTGADASRLKEAAAAKSASGNEWILDPSRSVEKDVKEVFETTKMSARSSGETSQFARQVEAKINAFEAQTVQKFDMVSEALDGADPRTWTSNGNQKQILSHMGRSLRS